MGNNVDIILRFIDEATAPIEGAVSRIKSAFGGITSAAGAVASKATSLVGGMVGGIKNRFTELASHAKWASAIFGTVLVKAISDVVNTAAQFERFGVAAKFLTGSTEEANKFAKAVREISKETMFNVDQIAELGSRLVGNTKNVDQSMKALRALSDAVAATGGGYGELESTVRAWIQTNSKAKASSEELNRQFSNANIPALRILAESIERDANHPLRKYLLAASNAGGATKKLTTEYTNASKNLGLYKERLEIANQRLKEYSENQKTKKSTLMAATTAQDEARKKVEQAEASIRSYTQAQSSANTAVKAFTVDGIMAQLQELGDLDIPGALMAESIIKAASEAYGGANAQLVKTFTGQVSLLRDTLVLTGLAFMGLDENFRPVEGGLLDLLKNAIEPLVSFLQNHQEDISKFASQLGKSTPFLMAFGAAIMGILLPALIGLLAPLIEVGLIAGAVGFAIGLLVEKLGGFPAIANAVTGFFQSLPVVMSNAQNAFVDFLKNIGLFDPLVKSFNFMKETIVQVVGVVIPWLKTLWGGLVEVAKGLAEKFAPVGEALMKKLAPAFGQLITAVINLYTALRPVFYAIGVILGALATVFIAIISGILNALLKVLPSIIQIFSGIVNFLAGFINYIIAIFSGDIDGAIAAFSQMFLGIKDVVFGVILSIWNLISGFVGGVVNFFKGMYDTLVGQGIIPDFIAQIKNYFNSLVVTVIARIAGFIISMIQFFYNLDTNISNAIKKIVSTVIVGFADMVITGILKFTDFVSKITNSANSLKTTLVNIFKDIWAGIKNVMGGMINDAYNWGKDLITNMISGLKDKISSIGGKMASALKDYLNIKMQHGGIVPGAIGQPIPIIAHGGERIIPAGGANVNSGTRSGAGNMTFNFYGGVTMDSKERVQELADRIVDILGRQNELARYGVSI